MNVLKKIFLWIEVIVFFIFQPIGCLSVWAHLTFNRIHYHQIIMNCGWENIPYLPRIYIFYFIVFVIISLIISFFYSKLILRGIPVKYQKKLKLSSRMIVMLKILNILFLIVLVETVIWLVFFEFYFPWRRSDMLQFSTCLEEQYVSADTMNFSFPEKKKNLIYIVCESMENSFSYPEFYGENLMPEMTRLASENDSFAGCHSVFGTDCTLLSLYSGQLGIPFWMPRGFSFMHKKYSDYPFAGCLSLFQILEKNGYQIEYMQGGSIFYVGKNKIYERVPGIRIHSLETLKTDLEYRKQKKKSQWGVNDRILWRYAKEELLKLNHGGKPFGIQILTVDTHYPDPYIDENANRKFKDYRDVVRMQSRMVGDFVAWLKQQDFYHDTLIVITGDHVAFNHFPSEEKIRDCLPGFQRTVYNCFINSSVRSKEGPEIGRERVWAVFDMMPTLLEAMGVTWQSHRLGVGTSLYSGEKTWLEKIGLETYGLEMQKLSRCYERLR